MRAAEPVRPAGLGCRGRPRCSPTLPTSPRRSCSRVSGGPDSTALLVLAARWRAALRARRSAISLAVTVDHGLRPESAREAAARRRGWRDAARRRAPRRCAGTAHKPATGLQEAARAARYRLLAAAARHIAARATSSPRIRCDDQAETVLIRLARGSGLDRALPAWRERAVPRRARLAGAAASRHCPRRGWSPRCEARAASPSRDGSLEPRSRASPARGCARLMPALAAEGLDRGAAGAAGAAAGAGRGRRSKPRADGGAARSGGRGAASGDFDSTRRAFADLPEEVALRLLGAGDRAGSATRAAARTRQARSAARRALAGAVQPERRRFRRTLGGALGDAQSGRARRAVRGRRGRPAAAAGRREVRQTARMHRRTLCPRSADLCLRRLRAHSLGRCPAADLH